MDNVSEIQKILNEVDALGLEDELLVGLIKATAKSAYLTGVQQGMRDAVKIYEEVYKKGGKRG